MAIAALTVGLAAAVGVWLGTAPPGPGLDPDAASYLGAAQSVVRGGGYRIPIAHWASPDSTSPLAHFPPGYPTALALPIALGSGPLQAARVVNAVAAFVEIVGVIWIVATAAGAVAAFAVAASLLVMHPLVMVHLSVLSEPLFLAAIICALAAMVALPRADDEQSRLVIALAGGLAAAMAVLSRYAGIAVVGAFVIWSCLQPATITVRVRRTAAAALPPLLLFGAWLLRSYLTSGPRSIRTLGAYGGLGETLRMGASTIVAFLVPLTSDDNLPARPWIALALLLGVTYLVVRGIRGAARPSIAWSALIAAVLLAILYLGVVVASRLIADPNIPFDERILAPLFVIGVIISAVATRQWWRQARLPARVVCVVLVVAWFGASFRASQDDVAWLMENGEDFAQAQWTSSPLLAWARANASGRPLYSNWPAAIVFHLNRAAHEVPNDSTDAVLRAFADTLRVRRGVVLAFDQPSPDQIGGEALKRAPGLEPIARLSDGTVFVSAP